MDEFPGVIVVLGILILATIGAVALVVDMRDYNYIYNQCKTKGFIQDKQTKITCKVEY